MVPRSAGGIARAVGRWFVPALLENHFPALHGLRVLAVISVVQIHVTIVLGRMSIIPPNRWTGLSMNVVFGMDLFFFLSGFLIGTLLIRALEAGRGVRSILRFYGRRALRIVPLYWIVLTALVLIYPFPPERTANLAYEYAYLTNYLDRIQGATVMFWGWSLCVEEHFYLAAPILVVILAALPGRRSRMGLLVALWLLGLGIRLAAAAVIPEGSTRRDLLETLYVPTHMRLDIFVAGVAVAFLHSEWRAEVRRLLASRAAPFVVFGLLGACLFVLVSPATFGRAAAPWLRIVGFGGTTSIAYAPLVLWLIDGRGLARRFLSLPPFRAIATLGYGVYLVHIPACHLVLPVSLWLFDRGYSDGVIWVATLASILALSLVLAYALHVAVEKPVLLLRRRLVPPGPA